MQELNQERLQWASLMSQIFEKAPTIDFFFIQIQDKKIESQQNELYKEYENIKLKIDLFKDEINKDLKNEFE